MGIQIDASVFDCMTRDVISVHRDRELSFALRLMDQHDVSVLPVVDGSGCVCGILSISDLISATYDLQCNVAVLPHVSDCVRTTLTRVLVEDHSELKVKDHMTSHVETISPHASIEEAARKLIDCDVHHLPVVDDLGRPAGILAATDVVRAVAEAQSKETEGDLENSARWENEGGHV